MAKLEFNRNFNVMRVIKRLIYTILGLYVGGTVLTTFAGVMNCTNSPLFSGLSLIGWTVGTVTSNGTTYTGTCTSYAIADVAKTTTNVITDVSGSGILAVVGILAIASVVFEFVSW